jgi:hypothetical protein
MLNCVDDEAIARIEAYQAIQQLAIRYAIAIDSRDLDLMVEQWVPDVWMGKAFGAGRDAVRRFFGEVLQGFYRSVHMIVGHEIHVTGPDTATGRVYCRAEHESGANWVVQAIVYEDTYRRVGQSWGFAKRVHRHWYSTPIDEAPSGPTFENWPGRTGPLPDLPHRWQSWDRFWGNVDPKIKHARTEYPDQPTFAT